MISRFIVRTGNPIAAALLSAVAFAKPALADASLTAVYQHQTLRFTHVASLSGATAIGVEDPGFQMLLRVSGAFLTWKPGERYILITTSAPVVVSFSLGDRRYDVGPISLEANFAPYERGTEAYLPFDEVLGALGLALRRDGNLSVLQPQLSGLDARQDGNRMILFAHGGATLHPRIVRESDAAITYAFDGVGTSLTGTRQLNAGGVRDLQVSVVGTVRDPITLVTVDLAAGAIAEAPRQEERDVALTIDGAAPAAPPNAPPVSEEAPTPEPAPEAQSSSGPALVTGVNVEPAQEGVSLLIAVTGNASYEWHRLRDPDNRFWVDIKGATLQGPPIEENAPPPLVSLRVKQDDPETVRVALTLSGPKSIALSPSTTGLSLMIGTQDIADAPRSGQGNLGSIVSASQQNTVLVTPAPLETALGSESSVDSTWKFAPRSKYVPTNPRLIVLDPGHGGSDRGTIHGGVEEANLTLDMAKRLRDILTARGWQVKLTRETDVDVYAPDDSARQELQARVDIANKAGARLFVSIHANAYINSGPYGTTLYISKSDDVAFARSIETQMSADGTKDDGIVKSHLYVTFHTRMPAVLIETAFLSNPSDFALLTSAAWRQKVAEEIADGIAEYVRENPLPNQPAQ